MQNLLRERVPVRDLATIIETLGDWATHTKDLTVLTEYVRNALRRMISAMYAETDDRGRQRLYCITMDPALEEIISGYIDRGPAGTTMSIPPHLANRIAAAVGKAGEALVAGGHQMIVLASPSVRAQVRQILESQIPGAVVLAYNEIVKGLEVESLGLVQPPPDAQVPLASAAACGDPTSRANSRSNASTCGPSGAIQFESNASSSSSRSAAPTSGSDR